MNDSLPAVQDLFLTGDGRLRSGWRFVIGLVCVVLAYLLAGLSASILTGGHPRIFDFAFRVLWAFFELCAFLFLTNTLDRPTGSVWQYNGLPRSNWLDESAIGALLGFVMVGLAVVFISLAFKFSISSLRVNARTLGISFVVLGLILAGAMAEELAFRGYPFQRLVEGGGPLMAILVLSALFAAIHLGNPHVSDNRFVKIFAFSNTLFIGIVLAIAYLRTRALWLAWGLHFGWNATLGLFFGLPVSGISDFSVLVRSRAIGPEWLLGGAYGIEGGFLGTVIILLGLLYVLWFVPKKIIEVAPPAAIAELPQESIQADSGASTDV
jgi:uncharacterized protein